MNISIFVLNEGFRNSLTKIIFFTNALLKGFMDNIWVKEIISYAKAFVIAFLIITFVFTTVGVMGTSMQPNLIGGSGPALVAAIKGDRFFVPKYETWLRRIGIMGNYQRGQIVVVREKPDSPFRQGRRALVVKRVIGIPGDTIAVTGGQVFINGQALDQSFITDGGISVGLSTSPAVTLGPKEYYIMGDNRTRSGDSRHYGPVPFMSITGRAAAVISPFRREGSWYPHVLKRPQAFKDLEEKLVGSN